MEEHWMFSCQGTSMVLAMDIWMTAIPQTLFKCNGRRCIREDEGNDAEMRDECSAL